MFCIKGLSGVHNMGLGTQHEEVDMISIKKICNRYYCNNFEDMAVFFSWIDVHFMIQEF